MFIFLLFFAAYCVEFDWAKSLKGEWEVDLEEYEIDQEEEKTTYHGFLNLTFSIESASMLSGKLKLENEEEELVAFKITADAETELTGTFTVVPISIDEEDAEMDIEDFEEDEEREDDAFEMPVKFEQNQLMFHVSNSLFNIGDNEGGFVVFTIVSANAWTITYVDKEKKVTQYVAKRINIPQSSWLVRFGPMIMMFAILVVPRLMGSALKPQMPQMPQGPPQDAPAGEGGKSKDE